MLADATNVNAITSRYGYFIRQLRHYAMHPFTLSRQGIKPNIVLIQGKSATTPPRTIPVYAAFFLDAAGVLLHRSIFMHDLYVKMFVANTAII